MRLGGLLLTVQAYPFEMRRYGQDEEDEVLQGGYPEALVDVQPDRDEVAGNPEGPVFDFLARHQVHGGKGQGGGGATALYEAERGRQEGGGWH